MPEVNVDINEGMSKVLSGIADVHALCDKNEEQNKVQIEKITDEVTKNLEAVNKIEAEQKSSAESLAKMEKLIINIAEAKGNDDGAMEKKAQGEFSCYLRNDAKMSEEVLRHNISAVVEKCSFGSSPKQKENLLDELLTKDMQVNTDPRGGYWVRPELSDIIITRVFETSPLRGLAASASTASDSLEFIIDDEEASGGWVCETGTRAKTDTPEIGKLIIYAHELSAVPYATQKMIDDAGFDIESWLAGKAADKFSRLENSAFVSGDGANKPRGFLTYTAASDPDVYERDKIGQLESEASGAVSSDDLKGLQALLKEPYQPNAAWGMSRKTFGEIVKLKTGLDHYALDPNSFKVGDTKILLGSNVIFMHDMPEIAGSSLSIVYADFSRAYTIVDRIGIRVLRDPFTARPYIIFPTTKRVGGAVTNFDSIKILKTKA